MPEMMTPEELVACLAVYVAKNGRGVGGTAVKLDHVLHMGLSSKG